MQPQFKYFLIILALVVLNAQYVVRNLPRQQRPNPVRLLQQAHPTQTEIDMDPVHVDAPTAAPVSLSTPANEVPWPTGVVSGAGDLSDDKATLSRLAAMNPNDVEVHLFIVWHGAYQRRADSLRLIASRFLVLNVCEFVWPMSSGKPRGATPRQDEFLMNLWRLYSGKGGWWLKDMQLKVEQCGRGPFTAVVVVDPSPVYRDEKTAHGVDHVSHNMHVMKQKLRKMAGGGFRVHGTYSRAEARHDIVLLYGRDPLDFWQDYTSQYITSHGHSSSRLALEGAGQRGCHTTNTTIGFSHWNSCEHFMFALSAANVNLRFAEGKLLTKSRKENPDDASSGLWKSSICELNRSTDVTVLVPQAVRWSVVAIMNGRPMDAHEHTAPTTFSVEVPTSEDPHREVTITVQEA